MKIARKVLSVLLAIAMILSTVAVAASAVIGTDESKYINRLWITAQKCDYSIGYEEGMDEETEEEYARNYISEMVYKGDESTTNEVTVEAGDIYEIKFYATTNYYSTFSTGALYFSSELMDINEQWNAVSSQFELKEEPYNMDVACSLNPNNNYIKTTCMGSSGMGLALKSEQIASSAKTNLFDSVKKDDGDPYFADGDFDKYDLVQWLITPTVGKTAYKLGSTNTTKLPIFTFTVKIPDTAAAGSEYKFFIPQEARKTDTSGHMIWGQHDRSKSAITADDIQKTNLIFGDEMYFDLAGTELTLKIEGAAAQVDYTPLSTELAKYTTQAGFSLDNYKDDAKKTTFSDTLDAANEVLTKQSATEQKTITDLVSALQSAYEDLTLKDIDKSALKTLLDAADLCTLDDYKNDSNWATFAQARTDAWGVYNNEALTTILDQGTVDDAYTALDNAKKALVELDGCDYTALDAQITRYEGLTEANYTTASWTPAYTAYTAATAISRTLKATEANQLSISSAAATLKTALDNLVEADADYSVLQATYDLYKDYKQDDYESGWAAFNTALTKAKELLDNQTLKVKDQQTINDANTALVNAEGELVAYGAADYKDLQAAVNAKPEYYEQGANYYDKWQAYAEALATADQLLANQTLTSKDQKTINDATDALNGAKNALELKGADYSAVDLALTAIPASADLANYYTPASIEEMNGLLAGINRNLKINDQETVNDYVSLVETAIGKLELIKADKTALDAALTRAAAIKSEFYADDEFWTAFQSVYGDAQTMFADDTLTKKDNQKAVTDMADSLESAITALTPLGADYSDLETQIKAFEALTEANYTAASWSAVKSIYLQSNVVYLTKNNNPYSKENQGIVDTAADNLKKAIEEQLVEADASYTKLNAAKNAANAILEDPDNYIYTEKYLNGIMTALADAASVADGLKVKDQGTIDAAEKSINDAIDAVEYATYNYTTLTGLKLEWLALAEKKDEYTVATWDAVDEAYGKLVWTYTYEPSDYSKAVMQDNAFDLVFHKLTKAQPANYEAVVKAQQAANALKESDYTAGSWADLKSALGKVVTGLNENHQDEVTAMAAAINNAIANLSKLASYKDLDDKIAEVAEFYKGTIDVYTQESLNALELAYTNATTISRILTEDDQKTVDDIYAALADAFSKMELKLADFTDLQGACAEYDLKVAEKDKYTSKSWEAYANAVLLGKAAIANKLDITKQDIVTGYYNDIVNAKAGLAEKPVSGEGVFEAPTGEVANVAVANDFKFRVNARALKLQFVDAKGNTWTFARDDARLAIASYNDEGKALEFDLGPDVAYEDWTVTQWLPVGTYTVRVKYGNTWDDVNTKEIEIKAQIPANIEVYSYELATTEGTVAKVPVTVVTGTDITAVQVVKADGSTVTNAAPVAGDGKLTFTLNVTCGAWGENTVTVKVFYAGTWHEAGQLTYTAVK